MQLNTGFERDTVWQSAILYILRPLWQLAIVLVYALSAEWKWMNAELSIVAAVFMASNVLVSSRIDHHLWYRVRVRALYVESVVAIVICATALWVNPIGPASLILLPSLVALGWLERSGRIAVWVGIANVVLFVFGVQSALSNGSVNAANQQSIMVLILYGCVILLVFALTWLVKQQTNEREDLQRLVQQFQQQSEQLSRVNEQVNAYANKVYDLATVDERNRIAGEIHDTVAHRLTALIVQLQAGRRMMESGDLAAATDNVRVSEELARESLDEVRRSVRAIQRKSSDEGVAALRRLSLHYGSLTGMTIEFDASPQIEELPAQLMAALYRVIQEGLTNAQRHGRATKVEIHLQKAGPMLILAIQDNGKGSTKPTLGFGLSTMQNRLRHYGGDIQVETQPGMGFCLTLTIPLWEEGVR